MLLSRWNGHLRAGNVLARVASIAVALAVVSVAVRVTVAEQGRVICGSTRARIIGLAAGAPAALTLAAIGFGVLALALRTRRKGEAITAIIAAILVLVVAAPLALMTCY